MTTRTLTSTAAAVALAGAAVLGMSAPAAAQQYPPRSGATISDSTVVPGQKVTAVTAPGSFVPGTTVTVTIPGTSVTGTAVVGANGSASFTFTLPRGTAAGRYSVVFSGGGRTASVAFTAVAAAAAGPGNGQGNGQGNLPRTGSDQLVPLTITGLVLVGVGGGIVVASRRRRESLPGGLAV